MTTPARAQAAVASAGAASRRGGYYRKAKRGHTLPIHINNTDRLTTVASVDTPASLQRRYSAAAPTARRLSRPNTVATGDGSALTNPDAARRASQPPGQPGRSWRRVLRGPGTPALSLEGARGIGRGEAGSVFWRGERRRTSGLCGLNAAVGGTSAVAAAAAHAGCKQHRGALRRSASAAGLRST